MISSLQVQIGKPSMNWSFACLAAVHCDRLHAACSLSTSSSVCSGFPSSVLFESSATLVCSPTWQLISRGYSNCNGRRSKVVRLSLAGSFNTAPLTRPSLPTIVSLTRASFQNSQGWCSSCTSTMSSTAIGEPSLLPWLLRCDSLNCNSGRYSRLHLFQNWLMTLVRCFTRLLRWSESTSKSSSLLSLW